MLANIEFYWQRFNLLTQREKLMIVSAFLLVIWGCWDNFFFQQLQTENQTLENEITSLQNQFDNKLKIANQLEGISQPNPNDHSRIQLTQLQQSVSNLKQQLNLGGKKFVPSESMAHALTDILKQNNRLKLIKLETLPVTSFGNNDKQTDWLYCHTLAITLQGDYFSTLNYLKTLESLTWRINWDSMDYQVKNYPIAETHIQVYTLSFDKEWLGV
ncbi:hypothetical protein [Methylomonas sp. AM2-LC]|uniref:hypothetical protein n=1 Tax=Methylomonas sp. AM2-LC TaxID=3153301 RepID=UPI0032678581